MQGHNPYDPAAFFPAWRAAGAPSGPVYANPSSTHPVYPPPSVLVLIPFALLPWPLANATLTLLTTASYIAAVLLFARLVPRTWADPPKHLFLAYALALAPAHSALHVSNLACLSASLLFLALYRILVSGSYPCVKPPPTSGDLPARPDILTAALLALSLCLKPTLAPLFLLLLVSRRNWKTLAATLTAGLALSAISLYPLLRQNDPWLKDLTRNIHFVFSQGSASLAATNLTRFDRIDLQLPLYALTHSGATALLASLITASLLLAWALASRERRLPLTIDHTLLQISALLIIGLLPVYQRFYSAILVLPLALWSFRNLPQTSARWTLALSCLFLINTEVLQQKLGIVPAGSLHLTFVQNAFIGPHLNWILLVSAAALVLLLHRASSKNTLPT